MPAAQKKSDELLPPTPSLLNPARLFLFLHWLFINQWLQEQKEPPPVPLNQGAVSEWIYEAEEQLRTTKQYLSEYELCERYLGHVPPKIEPDPKQLEEELILRGVQLMRSAVSQGWTDERITTWLSSYFRSVTQAKRGRPARTVSSDGIALRALELHDFDPKGWTYPMLADVLLGCRKHKQHTADSECVDKLKKAVARLRAFLREIGYEQAGK